MLQELRESYITKYESPIAARAHYAVLDGWADESTGSIEFGEAVDRIGRRLVVEDSQGFVSVTRYATEAEAREDFNRVASAYSAWDDEDDCEDD